MNEPSEKHRLESALEDRHGAFASSWEIGASELPSSPQERVHYWCSLIASWRRRHGARVPERLLMGLSEAEYTAALHEVRSAGHDTGGISSLEAAVARVRRRVASGGDLSA